MEPFIIEICSVQITCQGNEADGYVTGKDEVPIPCCEQCGMLLMQHSVE